MHIVSRTCVNVFEHSACRSFFSETIEVTTHDAKIYHQILLDEGLSGAPGWGHADGEVACPKLLVLGAAEGPEAMETVSDAARPDASIREKSTTEEEMVEAVCTNTHTHTHTVSIQYPYTVSIQYPYSKRTRALTCQNV